MICLFEVPYAKLFLDDEDFLAASLLLSHPSYNLPPPPPLPPPPSPSPLRSQPRDKDFWPVITCIREVKKEKDERKHKRASLCERGGEQRTVEEAVSPSETTACVEKSNIMDLFHTARPEDEGKGREERWIDVYIYKKKKDV